MPENAHMRQWTGVSEIVEEVKANVREEGRRSVLASWLAAGSRAALSSERMSVTEVPSLPRLKSESLSDSVMYMFGNRELSMMNDEIRLSSVDIGHVLLRINFSKLPQTGHLSWCPS
jgi:hypothetical protein